MVRRLVVGTLKGGAATCITASQLAIWLSLQGRGPVLAADTTADQSTYEWMRAVRAQLLEKGAGSPAARIDAVDLSRGGGRRLHSLERTYAYSIVHVEPKRPDLLREMLRQADGAQQAVDLIIPMKPYPLDLRKLPPTLALAREAGWSSPVAPRVLLVQVRMGADNAAKVPNMLDAKGIPRFQTAIALKESIGYSPFTIRVDAAYADVLAELGISAPTMPAPTRKDTTHA